MLTIRLDAPTPLADQIVTGIRCAIASREVHPGEGLPTVRQLAADLGINMNTVSRAYRALEASGLVSTVRGRGTVVSANQASGAENGAAELRARVRSVLSDARLAGLDRPDTERLVRDEIQTIWSKE
jgi:DNA-binding transcriptional regulator YhcF (GntR family)